MNNLSVDCDCDAHPDAPEMKDVGILASRDPVALDKACLDLIFNHQSTAGDDNTPLINRINRQHGTHIVEYAEQIGLGMQSYSLIELDGASIDDITASNGVRLYNVFDLNGVKILSNATPLESLASGVYMYNHPRYHL